ncbi:MAG: hypothetical protein K1X28_04405 [Parachlamydiales bacterium]|nr:hypothetical protein [Parachlamydiales bacterium]
MAANVNQRPVQVDWNPEPVKADIKKALIVITDISASCLKGPLKEACASKFGAGPANLSVEMGMCVTTMVVQKGLEYSVDKCFETPQSLGSRCIRKLKK